MDQTSVAEMKKLVLDYLDKEGFPMSRCKVGPRSIDLLIGGGITTIPLTRSGGYRATGAMMLRLKHAVMVWADTDKRQIDLEDVIRERASA
jgi:hypothetical protein